jgi:ABC-2 type transport system permease protein
MLAALAVVTLVALLLARAPAGLTQVGVPRLCAAVASSAALGLAYAAIAFTAGAAGARRGVAIAAATGLAVVGFMLEGLGEAVTSLRPLRAAMPWHWLLGTDPLRNGLSWQSLGLPLALAVALAAAGTASFAHRDLR